MPIVKTRKIFISHCWDYDNIHKTIVEWMNDANYFNHSDYSITQEKAFEVMPKPQLANEIAEQIKQASIIIAPTGMYMAYSDWVEFEINTAVSMGKPILAVTPWGQEREAQIITANATKKVGWRASSIIDAVRELC